MEATPVLVSIKPGPGLVSRRDVMESLIEGDAEAACYSLIAVLENVEMALTRRIAALEG